MRLWGDPPPLPSRLLAPGRAAAVPEDAAHGELEPRVLHREPQPRLGVRAGFCERDHLARLKGTRGRVDERLDAPEVEGEVHRAVH
jgi:hypothetical protein